MKNSTYCFKQANRFRAHGRYEDFCFWATKARDARKAERRQMRRSTGRTSNGRYIACFKKALRSLDIAVHSMSYSTKPSDQARAA